MLIYTPVCLLWWASDTFLSLSAYTFLQRTSILSLVLTVELHASTGSVKSLIKLMEKSERYTSTHLKQGIGFPGHRQIHEFLASISQFPAHHIFYSVDHKTTLDILSSTRFISQSSSVCRNIMLKERAASNNIGSCMHPPNTLSATHLSYTLP